MEKVSHRVAFSRGTKMTFMKSAVVGILTVGLALSGFAGVPSIDELTETLSGGPWAELPVRTVAAVRHAKAGDRKEMTIAAVKAALRLNPAAATAVVGSISRGVPAMTSLAAETAASEQPKQAADIALAAAAANHAAAADIVVGVCRSVPAQYESIADAVSDAVPGSGKEILEAVKKVQPGLKEPIDQVVSQYKEKLPPVSEVLAEAKAVSGGDSLNRKPFIYIKHKGVDHGPVNTGQGSAPPDQYKSP
jgi:hypothetical protein